MEAFDIFNREYETIALSVNPNDSFIFAGKTLEDINDRGTELEKYIIDNRYTPLVKRVFEALQDAEEAGLPIDQQAVLDILQSDLPPRERLNAAINEIMGCDSEK